MIRKFKLILDFTGDQAQVRVNVPRGYYEQFSPEDEPDRALYAAENQYLERPFLPTAATIKG
jgi:hypothetical protein